MKGLINRLAKSFEHLAPLGLVITGFGLALLTGHYQMRKAELEQLDQFIADREARIGVLNATLEGLRGDVEIATEFAPVDKEVV